MAAKTDDRSVVDLTASAVLELARLGRVTDETYDALKTATEPTDQADETADETAATKATAASKGASR